MKKTIIGTASGIILLGSLIAPAFAVKPAIPASMPKATGGYGYSIFDVQRNAEFNAQKLTADTCKISVNLTGHYVFNLYGGTYTHDIDIVQTGNNLYITGGYPAGSTPYVFNETGTGSVTGFDFTFTNVYTETLYTYTVNGKVNPLDGSITVTGWSSGPGSDWTVTGNATLLITGCDGRGSFNYSDVNGIYYTVDIRYVAVEDNKAWFTGPIVSGNFGVGQWIFIKEIDNGETGIGQDITAGDFPVTEAQGKFDVATHANPSLFTTITSGNIQVH